ncbi:fructose-2,6-bisphosphatase TIGAR B isoform X2 [Denticeps clupeoides]|uniref:fructose-2,6-bisphosphatase TIGAR B isoform X2 n=1 Tax=Denticeps clupeoides TaxID=299321 RepID=UPI0010A4204A|nr:fructose-2,6-bisphosphatase TIGAR isoform X2 [Denticeps clupeoides]
MMCCVTRRSGGGHRAVGQRAPAGRGRGPPPQGRPLHQRLRQQPPAGQAGQTAEILLRNNVHSADVELVSDALLRERVILPSASVGSCGGTFRHSARRLSCVLQGFGIAEGLPKEALKNMANAAGQSCRDFTPPGGETTEQVRKRFRKFLKSLFQRMATDHGFPEAGADVAHPAAQDEDGLGQLHAHALVVSHGAYIRVAVRHLVEELQCSLPPGSRVGQVFGACPNTGMCRFVVTLSRGETGPQPHAVHCLFVNRKEHLGGDED